MITIYGKDNCIFCTKAKILAEKEELEFTYISIEESGTSKEFKSSWPDVTKMPFILWEDEIVGGFTEFKEEILLRNEAITSVSRMLEYYSK